MRLRRASVGFLVPTVYVGVGSLVVAAYYLVGAPAGVPNWVPRLSFYGAVSLSAGVAVVVGVVIHRPVRRTAWLLIGLSQLVYFSADLCFYTYHFVLHNSTYPAPADALYLLHYPFLIVGLFLIGGRLRERSVVVDTLILGTSVAFLAWVSLIDPYTSAGASLISLTSLAFPVMDVMVLIVAIRLYVSANIRTPALYLMAGALAMLLFSDSAYGWMQIKGSYGAGNFLDATWMSSYLLLGACALHPSMRQLGEWRVTAAGLSLTRRRLALLAVASLAAPLLILVERIRHGHVDVVPGALASIVLFFLVVVRLRDANAGQERAVAALRRLQAERELLLGRVVEVAEEERMRLAVNLHDGPIQNLTAVALLADLLTRRAATGDIDAVLRHAEAIQEQVAAEMMSLRHLMADLRPPVLDERGLAAALGDCAEAVLDGEFAISMESNTAEMTIAPAVETALYRVAREAFINIRKHALASNVSVSLQASADAIELEIRDDGCGFEPTSNGASDPTHYGLTSMQELAASVGGSVQLASALGHGTRVTVSAPFERAANRQPVGAAAV